MINWDDERARDILNKYKKKYSIRLTFKIIKVVLALLIVFWLYTNALQAVYSFSNKGQQLKFYQQLSIDWMEPDLSTGPTSFYRAEITPFFTQKVEIELQRRIGKTDYVVSELQVTKPVLNRFTQRERTQTYPYVSIMDSRGFNFSMPRLTNAEYYFPSDPRETERSWETLEKIHEGHVANLAFSTHHFYSPEELLIMLEPYDVDVLWMPLRMGQGEFYNEGQYGRKRTTLERTWGLAPVRSSMYFNRGGMLYRNLDLETIDKAQQVMLENMDMMLNDNKRLAETLLKTEHLQERYDYLNEHGFQVYGAVVTGPVNELRRLQELEHRGEIHGVILGDIQLWNWHTDY